MNLHALIQHWTHGWPGMMFAAVLAEVGIVLGLVHGRGPFHKYLLSPILAVAIVALYIVVGGITMMMVNQWARAYATAYAYVLVLAVPLLGYLAGRMSGRTRLDTAHQRVRSAAVVLPPDRPFIEAAKEALIVRDGVAHASV